MAAAQGEADPMEGPAGGEGELRPWQMRACHFFFLLVALQLPFFDVPCLKGRCKTPMEIVAVELYSYNRAPHDLIRALLYPGTFAHTMQLVILGEASAPTRWRDLLAEYKAVPIRNAHEQPFPTSWETFKDADMDLIGGSFVVVFAAIMALFGPFVGASAGMALLLMYLYRTGLAPHTFMLFAAGCSLAWVPFHWLTESRPKAPVRPRAKQGEKRLRTRGKFKVY